MIVVTIPSRISSVRVSLCSANNTPDRTGWGASLLLHGVAIALAFFLTSSLNPSRPPEPFHWEVSLAQPPPSPGEQARPVSKPAPRSAQATKVSPQQIKAPQEIRRIKTQKTRPQVVAQSTPPLHQVVQKRTTSEFSQVHTLPHLKDLKAEVAITRDHSPPIQRPSHQVMRAENHMRATQDIRPHSTRVNTVAAFPSSLERPVKSSTEIPIESASSFAPTPIHTAAITAEPTVQKTGYLKNRLATKTAQMKANSSVISELSVYHQASVQAFPVQSVSGTPVSPPMATTSRTSVAKTHGQRKTIKRNLPSRKVSLNHPEPLIRPNTPKMNEPSVNGLSPEVLAFLNRLRQRIEQAREYPYAAKQMGFEGTTTIRFALLPNGNLQSLAVAYPSGYSMLDDAAIETIKKVLPLKPPTSAGNRPLSIEVPIKFWLN